MSARASAPLSNRESPIEGQRVPAARGELARVCQDADDDVRSIRFQTWGNT
ncbi:MAG: hypothetical protein AAFZ87_12510 [Planctomycetota bacterium]